MENNPIYDFLKANNLTSKDESSFISEYSDPAKAKKLHGFFVQNNLTTKKFDDFYGEYFDVKKKRPANTLWWSSIWWQRGKTFITAYFKHCFPISIKTTEKYYSIRIYRRRSKRK
jgi:hypothetical protein